MAEILLTSEKFVKEATSISDNLAGKYMRPAIREAQDMGLKGILGDTLLAKLKSLVADSTINEEGNAPYKALLDNCQWYLAYKTVCEVMRKVSYKIGNFGVTKNSDENVQTATLDEIAKQEYYYQSKADAYCYDLQTFILEHRADYPELTDAHCHRIQSNLYSSASCGIFLGGRRGRMTRR